MIEDYSEDDITSFTGFSVDSEPHYEQKEEAFPSIPTFGKYEHEDTSVEAPNDADIETVEPTSIGIETAEPTSIGTETATSESIGTGVAAIGLTLSYAAASQTTGNKLSVPLSMDTERLERTEDEMEGFPNTSPSPAGVRTVYLPSNVTTLFVVQEGEVHRFVLNREPRSRPNLRFLHNFAMERFGTLCNVVNHEPEPRKLISAVILVDIFGSCEMEYYERAMYYHRCFPPNPEHVPLPKYPIPEVKSVWYFINKHARQYNRTQAYL